MKKLSFILLLFLFNITNAQNVGVGELNPSARLVIKGSTTTQPVKALMVKNSNNDSLFGVRNNGSVEIGDVSAIVNNQILTISNKNQPLNLGIAMLANGVNLSDPGATNIIAFSNPSAGTRQFEINSYSGAQLNSHNIRFDYKDFSGGPPVINNLMYFKSDGKAGLGTIDPRYRLHVEEANYTGIYARSTASANDTSAIRGVLDNPSSAGPRAAGIRGVSTSTTAYSIGVYGTQNGGGWGIAGSVKEAGSGGWGAGVYGEAGLNGTSSGIGGYGVYGLNLNNAGAGGYFQDFFGNGVALRTQGTLQFLGIGEAANKVLTSNGSGMATWQNLPASSNAWTVSGGDIYNSNTGNVGVNVTPTAFAKFHARRIDNIFYSPSANLGAIYGENGSSNDGSGVTGVSGAPRSGSASYAGVSGQNLGNPGTDRFGVVGLSQGTSSGGVYSAGVGGYGDNGVLGYSQSSTGAGVLAQHASGKTALELNNGFIKVSGTNKTAFKHTTTAGNTPVGNYTNLTYDTPSINDIIIVTHNYTPNYTYLNKITGVYWTGTTWAIYLEDQTNMPLNISFNVIVIKQ